MTTRYLVVADRPTWTPSFATGPVASQWERGDLLVPAGCAATAVPDEDGDVYMVRDGDTRSNPTAAWISFSALRALGDDETGSEPAPAAGGMITVGALRHVLDLAGVDLDVDKLVADVRRYEEFVTQLTRR